jgi:LysR family transcriptional regulator, low CO2-responsive transcriptional regulator
MLDIDSLDLKRLRAFHLVARQGSLRLAATRLRQSIPAISGKIRKLEEDLGYDLFERLPNKLVLTLAGERVLREVDGLFERAEQAINALSNRGEEGRLALSVGSDHAWFFAPRIQKFLHVFPSIELNLRVYKSGEALIALDKGKVDVALGIFPPLPKQFEQHIMATSTFSLAYHPKAFGGRRKPSLADFAHQRLILPPSQTVSRRHVDRSLTPMLGKLSGHMEAPTCETACQFVDAGVGSAIVHSVCVAHHLSPQLHAVDLGPKGGTVTFSAVHKKGALRQPLIRALIEHLAG